MIEHEEKCYGTSDKAKCIGHYGGRPACLGFEPYCCSCDDARNRDMYFEIKDGEMAGSSGALHRLISAIQNARKFKTSEFRWKNTNGEEKVLKIKSDDGFNK